MTMVTSTAPGSPPGCAERPARILVVDDETSLAELLTLTLSYEGWEVRNAPDGTTALATAAVFTPDAVLLDMMLPDMEGTEVLRRLRAEWPGLPVVFLTARDSAEDRAAGLLAGADAYVTKPFGLDDIVTRLRVVLGATEPAALITAGDLELSVRDRSVRRGGVMVALSGPEFEVLHRLMAEPGATVSAADLGAHLPGGHPGVLVLCLTSLRRKLGVEISSAPEGYRLATR
ncbi:response regulator transcription factor [Actinoplanes sp. TFC3]|uniref:response regulator transcription factor n=1 Tax=Actinoplanes sp. TFC3 TaxID=1710355 RepID=UPI00083102BF|nr:response regulator [Actinoplanes sp. TFC3]